MVRIAEEFVLAGQQVAQQRGQFAFQRRLHPFAFRYRRPKVNSWYIGPVNWSALASLSFCDSTWSSCCVKISSAWPPLK